MYIIVATQHSNSCWVTDYPFWCKWL